MLRVLEFIVISLVLKHGWWDGIILPGPWFKEEDPKVTCSPVLTSLPQAKEYPFKANSSKLASCLIGGGQINEAVEKSRLKSNLAQLDLFTF